MRVACLVKRWQHHSPSAGYDHLATAVGATVFKRPELSQDMSKASGKIWNRLSNAGAYLEHYQFEDLWAEQRLLIRCLIDPPQAVHVLYGDEQLNLLLRWRRLLRCPLIVTFHLPAQRVAKRFEYFQSQELKGVDAAIVLAQSEISGFQRWFGTDKVVYVPHGIDTTRFKPNDHRSVDDGLRLLVVGHHMRDWEVIHRVIDEACRCNLGIQFEVVTPTEYFPYFTACANVTLYSQISESKLIELYRRADALFLPVTDATANNSVLEALACGLPVITTDIGGMPDYVTNDSGWLLPKGDVESIIELFKQLCLHRDIARSRRENARAQACKFDWRQIAERLSAIYSAVCAGQAPSAALSEFDQSARTVGSSANFLESKRLHKV
jgi:glycosyltransferase involved in cell wall biosynthesis